MQGDEGDGVIGVCALCGFAGSDTYVAFVMVWLCGHGVSVAIKQLVNAIFFFTLPVSGNKRSNI
jgi:hypothetical protein